MVKEADFYSAEEAAKALRIPVRQVFGMLCSGELEGHQDEWARWCVPASAVQCVRRDSRLSYVPGGSPEDDAGTRPAEDETLVGGAAATTVRSDGNPLRKPPSGADLPSGEETTQEADEAPVSGNPELYVHTESSDAETTERLPRGDYWGTAVPDAASEEIVRELTERLAAATAENRDLRARLELAEVAETALRESLEHERQKADRESVRSERERTATERPEEEPRARWGEGLWRRFFR
jgi:hypothetical protein